MQGVESVRKAIVNCRKHGVKYLTLYVFSTENWGRPQDEVDGLMELLCESVMKETDELVANGVRVEIIGDTDSMPPKVQEHLAIIKERTAQAQDLTVVLALNYSSRSEITRAARLLAGEVASGKLTADDINCEELEKRLYTAAYPNPDLVIRTSGEHRLSNFLLWQSAYAELYFTDTYWPDFGDEEFAEALEDFARRERRYGLITK